MPLSLQEIDTGTGPGTNDGDKGRVAFTTVNANNALIAGAIEDAERKAFVISCTDENQTIEERLTALGGSDNILRSFRIPYAFVVLEVRADVKLEDSGGDINLDILEDGISVLDSGGLVIPSGSETSVGHSPEPLTDHIILSDNAKIQIELISSPSGGISTGLNVTLIGYVIWATF